MRFLDENDKELNPEDLDMAKGYTKDDKVFVKHHEAQAEVKEVSHYETIKVYPNGGKDVKKVVDTPGQEAKDAWDEYEDIQRYVLYTQDELDKNALEQAPAVLEDSLKKQASLATLYTIQTRTDIDDNNAEQFSGLFADHVEKQAYKNGQIVRYKTALYRAVQDVPEGTEGTPDKLEGKYFNRIGKPDDKGNYSWLRPASNSQLYTNGDVVTWNGDTWKSDFNNNAFEPGVKGWTKL